MKWRQCRTIGVGGTGRGKAHTRCRVSRSTRPCRSESKKGQVADAPQPNHLLAVVRVISGLDVRHKRQSKCSDASSDSRAKKGRAMSNGRGKIWACSKMGTILFGMILGVILLMVDFSVTFAQSCVDDTRCQDEGQFLVCIKEPGADEGQCGLAPCNPLRPQGCFAQCFPTPPPPTLGFCAACDIRQEENNPVCGDLFCTFRGECQECRSSDDCRLIGECEFGLCLPEPECATSPILPSCIRRVTTNFLTFNGLDTGKTACDYYQAIGAMTKGSCNQFTSSQPNGITFNEWKSRNRLAVNLDDNGNGNLFDDDNTTGEASALYLNAVDLNLGRSMHGKKSLNVPEVGETVAYYVCNYPSLEEAQKNDNLVACVAMDYSVVTGVNEDKPFTRFFIFAGAKSLQPDVDLALQTGVDLDGKGEKFVPGVCTVCHGANDAQSRKPFAGEPDIGARFLPFDLDAFGYVRRSRTFSRRAQESKFRKLNQLIKSTNITDAVADLIKGWYPNNKGPQLSEFVPQGWRKDIPNQSFPLRAESVYLNVVKPACRTCHVVMRSSQDLDFAQFEDFNSNRTRALIQLHVCGLYDMPNSRVTFDRFWQSSDATGIGQPEFLQEFLDVSDDGIANESVDCPDPRTLP